MVNVKFYKFDEFDDEKEIVKEIKSFGRNKDNINISEITKLKGIFVYSCSKVRKRDKVQVASFKLGNYGYRMQGLIADLNTFGGIFQIMNIQPYTYFEDGDLIVTYVASSQKRHLTPEETARWGLDFN